MRPDVATALLLLFIPTLVLALSVRDWRYYRHAQWPPPLSLPASAVIVLVLLVTIWHETVAP